MSKESGVYSFSEITSQPTVWTQAAATFQRHADAFKALYASRPFNRVLFTGCGSTYYLSQIGAALFQQVARIPARAHPGSELALMPDTVLWPNDIPLLIAVSRSGETSETLAAVRTFRERTKGAVVTVTCDAATSLAKAADLTIALPEAQETSLAQTRSFASMLIAVQAMAALISGQDVTAIANIGQKAAALLDRYSDLARKLGQDRQIERFFFLGTGMLYGVACEGMLKMKEMSLSYSEAFHVLEFRHGPMSMVNENALVTGMLSDEAHAQEVAVLNEMRKRGAQILALGTPDQREGLDSSAHFVPIGWALPRWARPVTYLPVLQLLAYYRALSNGQDPDRPANLTFVISLNPSMM